MTPTLRRLVAIGIALSLLAAFAVAYTRPENPARPPRDQGGAVSVAALAVGASGLLAHRRRRAR